MAETIFWWIFLLSCMFAFFFGYRVVETLIRKWFRVAYPKVRYENLGFSDQEAITIRNYIKKANGFRYL